MMTLSKKRTFSILIQPIMYLCPCHISIKRTPAQQRQAHTTTLKKNKNHFKHDSRYTNSCTKIQT